MCSYAMTKSVPGKIAGDLEAGGSRGFVLEGGDRFDQARDGEGIADTALAADEVQSAALAGERNGKLHKSGNSGAIDLGNVMQVDDQLSRATLHQILSELRQMFAGLADREASVDLKVVDASRLARRDFQWWMKRHEISPQFDLDGC